jgi:hypothetical protein
MDSKRFDSIVKSFGTAASRRRMVRGAAATALGALGLGVGRRPSGGGPAELCHLHLRRGSPV